MSSRKTANIEIHILSNYTKRLPIDPQYVNIDDILKIENVETLKKIVGILLTWFGVVIEVNGHYFNIESLSQKVHTEVSKEFFPQDNKPIHLLAEFKEKLREISKLRYLKKTPIPMSDRINSAFADTYLKTIRDSNKIKFYEQINDAINTSILTKFIVE